MFYNQTTKTPLPSFLLIEAQPFFINAVENCNINVPTLSTIALNKKKSGFQLSTKNNVLF